MNLLFAIDRNFIDLFINCIHSIEANGGDYHYDAYILHSDIDAEMKSRIERSVSCKVSCHFIDVDTGIFKDFPKSKRYPIQIYYRIVAPLLLPADLERILYLDVDTIVINPLHALYNMDFEGNYFIACTHTRKLLTNLNKARLGVKNNVPYINTGVMLLNLGELRNNVSLDSMQRFAHRKRLSLMLPDQDIITALYGTKIKLADTMRFNLSDRILGFYNADIKNKRRNINWVRQNTAIIHYCGKNKPWKNNYTGKLGVFYHELLQEVRIKNAG